MTRNALRRSRVTVAVLVLFVALAAMLASSAITLLVTATRASEHLMLQARTPHFLQMHAGEVDTARMQDFADTNPLVVQSDVVDMLNVDGAAIRIRGDEVDTTLAPTLQDNSFVAQNEEFDFLLDSDGQVIHPEPGTVWLPMMHATELGVTTGDAVVVSGPGTETTFTVAGFLRDSQMNSTYASSKRLLISEPDLAALTEDMGDAAVLERLIQFRLTGPDAVGEFETQYREAGLEANGPTITWSLFVLVNSLSAGITAAILILVTVLLVGIALLCVRFTLLTTIQQDYREIGVLRAMGIRRRTLNRLYSNRYLALTLAGAVVGSAASLLLSRFLLADTARFMGIPDLGIAAWLLPAGAVVAVMLLVLFGVQRALRRTERVSPVQAIRGVIEPGKVRRAPRWLRLAEPGAGAVAKLAWADLLRRRGLYALPLVIYVLAAFIITVPQNLHSTVKAPEFFTYMGAGVSDLRIDVQQSPTTQQVEELDAQLAADPRIARHTVSTTASYTTPDETGRQTSLKLESGDQQAFPITYLEGVAPQTPEQLGLSRLQADELGAEVGDVLEINPVQSAGSGDVLRLEVTGIYQDITNGGRTARTPAVHTSSALMWATAAADVAEDADPRAVVAAYAADNPELKVSSVPEYVDATLGGAIDALRIGSWISLAIGLAVATLVTVLFMRLLMVTDAGQIAVQRALGVRDASIQFQYVLRAVVVLVGGVVLGALLANATGGALAGALLSSVGLSQLHLVANPWLAYLASPLALLLAVVIAALISTRPSANQSISQLIKE